MEEEGEFEATFFTPLSIHQTAYFSVFLAAVHVRDVEAAEFRFALRSLTGSDTIGLLLKFDSFARITTEVVTNLLL